MTLESLLLKEGQSAELGACFQVIKETTINEVNKYTDITCQKLGRAIVCRTYPSVVYELCQLVVVASDVDTDRRYESLFWGTGPARRASFHNWFQKLNKKSKRIEFTPDQAIISYAEKTFAITYERMPLLSALMEFLVTAIGYALLDDILSPLIMTFPNERLVSDTANTLSRAIYSYLQDHLPAVHDQRRRRDFLNFIAGRADGGSALSAINDQSLLEYWLAKGDAENDTSGSDTLTYRGVFKTAVRVLRLLQLANYKQGIDLALPIGTDYEAGEVEPTDIETLMEELDDVASPLCSLKETSQNGVKILNKNELEKLEYVLFDKIVVENLTQSILRNIIFGKSQARITQSLRRSADREAIMKIATEQPNSSYEDIFDALSKLALHLERMLLITFHVLIQAQHTDAVNAAFAIEPDLPLSSLAYDDLNRNSLSGMEGNVVSLQANLATKHFLQKAYDADPDNAIGALAQRAVIATRGMARQGFNQEAWQKQDVVELFSQALPALIGVRRELSDFLNSQTSSIDWKTLFETDTPLFQEQFSKLYGDYDG